MGAVAYEIWIRRGAVRLRHIEPADLPAISSILERLAEHKIDLADACLAWLAGMERCNRILATDRRDFALLRATDGRPFERVWVHP